MSSFYRKRNEGWSHKVDVAVLFLMAESTARIRKEAERTQNKRIIEEVGEMERAIATAYGKIENHDLKTYQMPEGETLPDTRPPLQDILDRYKARKVSQLDITGKKRPDNQNLKERKTKAL